MTEADQAEVLAVPDRTRTRLRQALTAQIDRSDAVEVTVEAGDCILLDPMCTPHTLPTATAPTSTAPMATAPTSTRLFSTPRPTPW